MEIRYEQIAHDLDLFLLVLLEINTLENRNMWHIVNIAATVLQNSLSLSLPLSQRRDGCACMCAHLLVCVCVRAHACVCVHACVSVHPCMCVCTLAWTVCMCTVCVCVHALVGTHICLYACLQACVHYA